ncbi:MAG: N-formylglutamate amidohydrolase [Asticcacaulis sp.]
MPADPQTADNIALFDFHPGDGPLVVAAPHVGTCVPPGIAAQMNETGLLLRETDFHVHRLFDFARGLGATTLFATHSRYVVDLNRDPGGGNLYPGRFETGLCPLSDFDQNPIYRPGQEPGQDDVKHRLELYWKPYHARLRRSLDEAVARHGPRLADRRPLDSRRHPESV